MGYAVYPEENLIRHLLYDVARMREDNHAPDEIVNMVVLRLEKQLKHIRDSRRARDLAMARRAEKAV